MKATLILAAAFALVASAAQAQTVAPGTAPGAQTGNPSNMPSAGDPSTDQQRVDSNRKNAMSGSDKSTMRKNKKMKTNSDGSMKMKTKM
jgi:hypothetical protein